MGEVSSRIEKYLSFLRKKCKVNDVENVVEITKKVSSKSAQMMLKKVSFNLS